MVISQMLYYILLCVSVGLGIVSTCVAVLKGKKSKNSCEFDKSDCKSISQEIISKIPQYMVAAEQLYNALVPNGVQKTGAQKLSYVLDKIKIDCLSANMEYNEDEVTKEVEKLIDLTKQVNK